MPSSQIRGNQAAGRGVPVHAGHGVSAGENIMIQVCHRRPAAGWGGGPEAEAPGKARVQAGKAPQGGPWLHK